MRYVNTTKKRKSWSMNNELKNCPFCGEKAEIYEGWRYASGDYNYYDVICTGCGISTNIEADSKTCEHMLDAIQAWNTRAEPKPTSAEVQEALKGLPDINILEVALHECEHGFTPQIEVSARHIKTIKSALERMGDE